jgi:hypothetical protein
MINTFYLKLFMLRYMKVYDVIYENDWLEEEGN